jgi:hypothetical protein
MTMNVDEEIERLKTEIGRLGTKNDDGSITVSTCCFLCCSLLVVCVVGLVVFKMLGCLSVLVMCTVEHIPQSHCETQTFGVHSVTVLWHVVLMLLAFFELGLAFS